LIQLNDITKIAKSIYAEAGWDIDKMVFSLGDFNKPEVQEETAETLSTQKAAFILAEEAEEAAIEQLRFYNEHLVKRDGTEYIETGEKDWRTHSLKPEYEFKAVRDYGTGLYVVHKETGKVCEHTNEWFCNGEVLICTICHFEGT